MQWGPHARARRSCWSGWRVRIAFLLVCGILHSIHGILHLLFYVFSLGIILLARKPPVQQLGSMRLFAELNEKISKCDLFRRPEVELTIKIRLANNMIIRLNKYLRLPPSGSAFTFFSLFMFFGFLFLNPFPADLVPFRSLRRPRIPSLRRQGRDISWMAKS